MLRLLIHRRRRGYAGAGIYKYQRCRQYIKDIFVELTSLAAIAEGCSVDHAYLCRLFKRFDTQSPINTSFSYKGPMRPALHKPGYFVKNSPKAGLKTPHFTRTFSGIRNPSQHLMACDIKSLWTS
jgi:hypothetical protein